MLDRPLHQQLRRTRLGRPAFACSVDGIAAAGEVLRRERIGARGKLAGRAFEDDLPAVLARTRTEVEQAVRRQHDLRVVLDDEQRVAVVAQPVHDLDHPPHVAGMQAHRGLVEHEQRIDQRGAERRGQVDALHLTAGQRA